jgi:hypothetical protein
MNLWQKNIFLLLLIIICNYKVIEKIETSSYRSVELVLHVPGDELSYAACNNVLKDTIFLYIDNKKEFDSYKVNDIVKYKINTNKASK